MQKNFFDSHQAKTIRALPRALDRLLEALGIFLLVIGISCFATPAAAERRLAFVAGIDNYENVSRLQKAGNDARAIARALGELGFEVTTMIDPERRAFNRELARFSASIHPGDVVVFFFAGHGIGLNGRNYLLPADIPSAQQGDAQFVISESIAADQVSSIFQAQGARLTFLILDACRNNPFASSGTRGLGAERGLSRMDPAEGAFILFSAGTGQTALDRLSSSDPDPNSVFTRALLPRLHATGLSVHELVREVRNDVRRLAASVNHQQFPAYYDQLSGSFSFKPERSQPGTETLEASVPAQTERICDAARSDWSILQSTQSAEALRQFSGTYAECPIYVAAAQDRLATISARTPEPKTVPDPTQPAASLGTLSCEDLWYARNLIFYKKGYCFQTNRAKAIFDTSACNTRNPILSATERQEVDRLSALERANGC